jgi:hypothetical protein
MRGTRENARKGATIKRLGNRKLEGNCIINFSTKIKM